MQKVQFNGSLFLLWKISSVESVLAVYQIKKSASFTKTNKAVPLN